MKKMALFIIILMPILCSGLTGCMNPILIQGTGTVIYVDIEGGFYGILSDSSFFGFTNLDPINLPVEFQQDGLQVSFKAQILWNHMSFHMWGLVIRILEIEAHP